MIPLVHCISAEEHILVYTVLCISVEKGEASKFREGQTTLPPSIIIGVACIFHEVLNVSKKRTNMVIVKPSAV